MKTSYIHLQPELILFLSLLVYTSKDLVLPFIAACILHEFGHIAMLHCIKHCIKQWSIDSFGMNITSSALSYKQTILSALAGPLMNLLGILYAPLSPAFAFYNLILGIYNLLPLSFLDGGTILHALLSLFLPLRKADSIASKVTLITLVLIIIIGVTAALHFGPFPFLLSLLLLFRCIKEYDLVSWIRE